MSGADHGPEGPRPRAAAPAPPARPVPAEGSERWARSAGAAVLAAVATLATATALVPLVDGLTWLAETAAAVAVVAVVGSLVGRLTRSLLVVVGAQLVLVLVLLGLLYGPSAPGAAISGAVGSTGLVDGLRALVAQGREVVRSGVPPVSDPPGLRLLLVAPLALVAVAVDALVVRLREPAAAGVPLLALFSAAVVLDRDGVPWGAFVLAAAAYLLLLAAQARLTTSSWGRAVPARHVGGPGPPRTGPLPGALLATGAAAVALALAVPAALPWQGTGLAAVSGGGVVGSAAGARVNPLLDLGDDLSACADVTVLTYRRQAPTGAPADPAPLRLVTVDTFDGESWRPDGDDVPLTQDADGAFPPPPGLDVTTALATGAAFRETLQVQVGALRQEYLPAPYPVRDLSVGDGTWLYRASTLDVVGAGTRTRRDQTYTLDYLRLSPDAQQLADAGPAPAELVDTWTALPEDLPAVIGDTARQVAGSGTPLEQASRLQAWFRGSGFTYSEQAPGGTGTSSVVAFLQRRSGYCVHFASTMALMARSLGIPARVSVGFLPGTTVGTSGGDSVYRVSLRDAHAWPELYFSGAGWVRFEPTPGQRTGQAPAYTDPAAVDAATSPTPTPTAATPTTPTDVAPAPAPAPSSSSASAGSAAWSQALPWLLGVLGALVLLVLLASPAGLAQVRRRRRWSRAAGAGAAAVAETAWAQLQAQLADLGHELPASATVRGQEVLVLGLLGRDDEVTAALARRRGAVETARYAPVGVGGGGPSGASGAAPEHVDARSAQEDVQVVVAAVRSRSTRQRRWRAAAWPVHELRA